ncbi:MAG: 3-hydroxyacyl-ACP dehydratase [Bacteroidia bacterium]
MNKPLLNNFYTIVGTTGHSADPNAFEATIRLNEDHPVYDGHFPGSPVTPGVVLVQIIKEVLEKELNKKTFLSEGDNIKFLAPVIPGAQKSLTLQYAVSGEKEIIANVNCIGGGTTFLKFKGKFKVL